MLFINFLDKEITEMRWIQSKEKKKKKGRIHREDAESSFEVHSPR